MMSGVVGVAMLTAMTFDVDALAGPGFGGAPWQSSNVLAGGQASLDVDLELSWFYVGASAQMLLYVNVPDPHFGPVLFSPGIGPHAGFIFGDAPFRLFVDVGGYAAPVIDTLSDGGGQQLLVLPAGQVRARGEWLVTDTMSLNVAADATLTFVPGGVLSLVPAVLAGASWRFSP